VPTSEGVVELEPRVAQWDGQPVLVALGSERTSFELFGADPWQQQWALPEQAIRHAPPEAPSPCPCSAPPKRKNAARIAHAWARLRRARSELRAGFGDMGRQA